MDRFDTCKENIKTGTHNVLLDQGKVLEELLSQRTNATHLLNNTIETGEKLYSSTSPEGRDIISGQLQDLQQAMERLFDDISATDLHLKGNINK